MIAVDTNVLLRFLVDDDPEQNRLARDFMAARTIEDPAYVSALVLAETVWLLRKRLGYPWASILNLLRALLAAAELVIEHAEDLDLLVEKAETLRADLSDHLIVWAARKAGCRKTVTFDREAAGTIAGMELLT
ncbi:hypothetical protein BJF92_05485 [Rhizobium rhizosphaerae]|uniref:Ribonuclease VapC n=1 Tax=Xaviernesmea rhizosphaerae TaxID=1672749 RepID=A0A1Q9AFF5_9HYPH|nr:PIN domain-containing protein [Xaviernesmea rhizosphaerae]OLP53606.1 hypothetical protein BJF92_05485 [Xaviernesmea rhizosphaerae]OQP86323.1 hypothetical protein BTR14_11630 [Xaviernesmea rhizosphaerae]